jgi:hypothetical protein
MSNGYFENRAKIKNNTVIVYRKWIGDKTQKMLECNLLKNFQGSANENIENVTENPTIARNPYCGQLTEGARKRMIETIELFSASITDRWVYNKYLKKRVKHKFSFITLTIPDQSRRIKGKEGYDKLLEPFLFWLVKTKKVNTYIWKAELQQPLDFQGRVKVCKGQLHYHLILPNFIDKQEIRKKWNYILKQNDLLAGHGSPSSTSIERPYKGKYVSDYIIKEIAKNCQSTKKQKELSKELKKDIGKGCKALLSMELEYYNELAKTENQSIEGKVWGCSNNLKPKKTLKPDADLNSLVDIEKKIDKLVKEIKDNQSNPDKLIEDKKVLYSLRRSKLDLYKSQKNYYEVEFTERLGRKLDLTFNIYEESCEWHKSKNIYQNDYVTIYKLPMYYHEIMLDCTFVDNNNKSKFYLDEYKDFLKDRVGEVFTEKTTQKQVISYHNQLASLIIEQKEKKNYIRKKLKVWTQEKLFL